MSECSLSGRGQGHVSSFYNVDLENFAGDIHNSTVVGLFMTPETMGADSVASWMSAHCLSPTKFPTSYHRFGQDLSYK